MKADTLSTDFSKKVTFQRKFGSQGVSAFFNTMLNKKYHKLTIIILT